ncbi:TolC family outer membrane protein [Vibrio sp. 10N]|uniref:TolC family outer membrane protein n=1 Tax=Vibrio sp. 10N TaxID=3058938 RepID=UPI0028139288|nr:outer membrane channel protein TolC [Vibrio sp. 10N]
MQSRFSLAALTLLLANTVYAESILDVYNTAKVSDPMLLQAKAQSEEAKEGINSMRSVLLPQLDLTAGYDYYNSDRPLLSSEQWRAGVQFSQEIYNPASWIHLEQAEKSAVRGGVMYAQAQQGLIIRVAEAYFNVLKAEDALKLTQAEKAAIEKYASTINEAYRVGTADLTDLQDARAQLDRVSATLVKIRNQVRNSYEALRKITKVSYQDLDTLSVERFSASLPTLSADSMVELALQENLSILSETMAKDIAKTDIELAQSGHLPHLSLNAGYQYSNEQRDDSFYSKGGSNDTYGGLNFVVPLYSGGGTSSQVKQAELRYVAASQGLEKVYRDVSSDVRGTYNDILASLEDIKAQQQSTTSAELALSTQQLGLEVGTRTIVDVLQATSFYYDAQLRLSNARYNYILNRLYLKQLVGNLNEGDILSIHQGLSQVQ